MSSTARSMRALVFDAAASDTSTSRVADLPIPEPAQGQVSIDVVYAGVNFKDVMARRGDPGYVTRWPFVPGLEVAGTIRALGADVTGLAPGDPVVAFTGQGGLAEVAVAEAALTARVPDGLALDRAAAAPGALVTAELLVGDLGRLRPGESVLVHSAAGGVGQAAAALARLAGAGLVMGTVGAPGRAAAAREAGYDSVLLRGPGLASAVREATNGRGADLVLDPQGTALVNVDLQLAAPGARIVLFGNATGAPFAPLPPLQALMLANATITGFSLGALAATAPALVAGALTRVLAHLARGDLDIELTTVNGLAAAAGAQQALAEGRGSGKQIVRMRSLDAQRPNRSAAL